MLRGALAAAVTPLRDEGAALDEEAFGPYLEFLDAGGLDGILALARPARGSCSPSRERRRAAELFLEGPLPAIVHCGAQTTAETVALAEHAAGAGAAGVAVIGPPYYALDDEALLAHFAAAARACEPLPFYVYEFKARSGYAVPVAGARAAARAGAEPGRPEGLRQAARGGRAVSARRARRLRRARRSSLPGCSGAAGAVSGLASVFPERVVALGASTRRRPRGARGARPLPVPGGRRSSSSAGAACRCGRTSVGRCAR